MNTLHQRIGAAFVALLMTLSVLSVAPVTGAVTTDTIAQQEGDPLYDNATRIDVDDPINGEIGSDGVADVYAFDLSEGTQVEIRQGIGGGAAPVTLVDREGTVLDRVPNQSSLTTDEALIRANASYSGPYYLKIDGNAGDRYSIGLRAIEPDANEPNNDVDSATEIDIGETQQGTLVRGDTDYYAVDLDAGQTIGVLTNGSASGEVAILDPDGEVVERATVPAPGGQRESEQGLTPVVNATADAESTYTVVFSIPANVGGNVGGEYVFTVADQGEDATTTADEGDTTTESATTTADQTRTDVETTATDTEETDTAEGTTATDTEEATADETDTASDAGTATDDDAADTGTESATDRPEDPGTAATDTTTGTTVATGTEDGNDVDPDDVITAVEGPGFGMVGAIVALLGVALLATRRR